MDYDKSGNISLSEFTETRNLIRNFVKESKVDSLIVEIVTSLVNRIRMQKTAPAEFCAKQISADIAELTLQDLNAGLADIVPRALAGHAKTLLDTQNKTTNEQASGKFSDVATATYGDQDAFHKGLEAIGLPHPKILHHMRLETCQASDSLGIHAPSFHIPAVHAVPHSIPISLHF
jgi:hypothetical protein